MYTKVQLQNCSESQFAVCNVANGPHKSKYLKCHREGDDHHQPLTLLGSKFEDKK